MTKQLSTLTRDFELGCQQLKQFYEIRDRDRVITHKEKLNQQLASVDISNEVSYKEISENFLKIF